MLSAKRFTKSSTDYAKHMQALSNKIFGEISRPADLQSHSIVKRFSELPKEHRLCSRTHYYPFRLPMLHNMAKMLRLHGLYRDEHADWTEEMERNRVARGKVRPEIGKGKRARLKQDTLG